LSLDLQRVLAEAMFVSVRVGMLMIFAPFLDSAAISPRIKAGATFVITLLLYPSCGPRALALGAVDWWRVVIGEVMVGLLLGLTMQFVFEGAQLAGQILGFQFGFSLVNVIDPQTQVDTPVLAIFQQAVVLLIFLQLNVHHWLLRAMAQSFEIVPAGMLTVTPPTADIMLRAAGGMLLVAVQIAAPTLIATALADLALGFLGKAAPQLPVLFVGMSVKSVLGLAVMAASIAFWPRMLESHFRLALQASEHLLHLAH
jgi:flagellar biosynthesis protein FliR